MRRYARTLIVIAILFTLSSLLLGFQRIDLAGFERGGDTPLGLKLGLDLQGGFHLEYQAALKDPETGEDLEPTPDQMVHLRNTIEQRVNASGLGEPIIQIVGENRLLIQLPGIGDPSRAKSLIGETARLEVKHRKLNVELGAIQGASSDDIVDDLVAVRVASLVTTSTTSTAAALAGASVTTAGGAAGAGGEPSGTTTQPESTILPASTSTEAGTAERFATSTVFESGVPTLVLEFTDEGAEAFAKVVDRLQQSLNPLPGSDNIYPNLLTIAVEGDTAPMLRIPYYPVVPTRLGLIPLGGEPLILRSGQTNRFSIKLLGVVEDFAGAKERFGDREPSEFRLGEIAGKLDEDIGLTGDDLARAYAGQHQSTGQPVVNLEFNSDGARKFGEVTTIIAGTPDVTAFILDDVELIAPGADRPITGGSAFIYGADFTFDRVRDIALQLESGRLPIPIELIREFDVDAILGADSLSKSVVAGFVGLALVLLFMVMYYRALGVVAAASLMIYAVFVLAVFKIFDVTLTLAGVAAAILSIGMAVDANILIFERMKEELRVGRTLLSAANIGFNRAWPAIRDSNASTLITCAILFWFADTLGASRVQSFAITLAIGVGVSMFSAITVSRTLLRLVAATALRTRLKLFVPAGGGDLPQQQPGAESV